jgi:hypothetical protein
MGIGGGGFGTVSMHTHFKFPHTHAVWAAKIDGWGMFLPEAGAVEDPWKIADGAIWLSKLPEKF